MSNTLRDKFTLIIPLHERKAFIKDIIHYYEKASFNVIVSDSSREKLKSVFPENIKYLHFPEELYYKKLLKTANLIKTPYVADIPDDHLLDVRSIEHIVSFLDKNKNYNLADGWYHDKYNEITSSLIDNDYCFDDPLERIEFFTKNNVWKCPNHAVVSTSVFRNIFSFIVENPALYPARLCDKVWSFVSLFHGNYKALDLSYAYIQNSLRMIDYPSKYNYPTELQPQKTYEEIIKDEQIFEILSDYMVKFGYDKQDSLEFVSKIFKTRFI